MTDREVMSKLEQLRLERGWSVNKLARESDIPQTTLDSMFKKGNLPSIHTLLKLCNGFDISVSQFFCSSDEKQIELTDNQFTLLECYQQLSKQNQRLLITFATAMLETQKKK